MTPTLALLLAVTLAATACAAEPPAPVKRSSTPRRAFIRANPCPATGDANPRHACPGWRVDHVVPLACGGPDSPANMQWLTTEAWAAKSKWERSPCGRTAP